MKKVYGWWYFTLNVVSLLCFLMAVWAYYAVDYERSMFLFFLTICLDNIMIFRHLNAIEERRDSWVKERL